MKIYIASPFFNEKQINEVATLESMLDSVGIEYFSPRLSKGSDLYKGGTGEFCTPELIDTVKSLVFTEELAEMHTCDAIMVNGNNLDSGTLFELGYATSRKLLVQFFGSDVLEMKDHYKEMKESLNDFMESFGHNVAFSELAYFDSDLGTIFIKSESPKFQYHGISKFLLGAIYEKFRTQYHIIYFDTPRKSNLMLTSAVDVYEYDNMDMGIVQLTKIYLEHFNEFNRVYGRVDN